MKAKIIFRKDTPQTRVLVKAGRIAANTANRASRALGLSVTYIKDGIIYEEKEGVVVRKGHIEKQAETPFEIKKGLVLHAK
jgi:hypothetical protein